MEQQLEFKFKQSAVKCSLCPSCAESCYMDKLILHCPNY
jgi:hypothetical protein